MGIVKWINERPTIPILILFQVVVIATVLLVSSAANQPIPGADQGGDTIVVPQSPGLQSASLVCDKGEVQSQVFSVNPPPLVPIYEYVAELGADRLRWVDSGNNRVASLNGEEILLNDEVIKCFRDSR